MCGWPRPLAAQGPRADQGKVIARIIVEEGQVFLQTKSGKPIVVPGQLSLREGDVLTTSKDVKGRFELGGGKNLLLGRLRRYRVGRDGIQKVPVATPPPEGRMGDPLAERVVVIAISLDGSTVTRLPSCRPERSPPGDVSRILLLDAPRRASHTTGVG